MPSTSPSQQLELISFDQEKIPTNSQITRQSISQHKQQQTENNETNNNNNTLQAFSASLLSENVTPPQIIESAFGVGYKKINTPKEIILLKSILSGGYIAMATSLSVQAWSLGWDIVSGAIIFPIGFVMLILLGNDLATGNFGLLPMIYLKNKFNNNINYSNNINDNKNITVSSILLNWGLVLTGNAIGCIIVAFLIWSGFTHFGKLSTKDDAFTIQVLKIAMKKTISYKNSGIAGWFAAFVKGILCNWMVTMGVMMSLTGKSTISKIVAMWLPIFLFVALGLEHSIVNLYVLPLGLFYNEAQYNAADWILWNQIPVTIGNILGGMIFTGFAFYYIYARH